MDASSDDEDVPHLIEHTGDDDGSLNEPGPHKRVPLTVICGFLGAGKSTLLKRILTERHGYRIAVIVNEFGDTADIESRTINVSAAEGSTAAKQSEEILELANGCLCCSIKDKGIAAIEKLMQRKGAFDHILLETTGLADPGPIASIFWHNQEFATGLGRDIALDGVVCVVDAVFGAQQMEEDHATDSNSIGESLRQIAGSDVILLNKTDLASPGQLTRTEGLIHRVNPTAPIHRAVRANVDLKHIMEISAFASLPTNFTASGHDPDDAGCHNPDHNHTHCDDGPKHYELRGISCLQVPCPPLNKARFDKLDLWIRTVLWENHIPDYNDSACGGAAVMSPRLQVLRCKGLLPMESGELYVLQGVRSLYEIEKLADSDDDNWRWSNTTAKWEGKVVLIGKGLDEDVRRSLDDAMHCD